MGAAWRRFAEWDLFEDRPAYQRSMDLLVQCLSSAQRTEFDRSRAFTVRGGQSGRQYRINYGTTGNIAVLSRSGRVEYRLCAGPTGIPVPAVMLAQKLMLETQESDFLRIAGRYPGVRLTEREATSL